MVYKVTKLPVVFPQMQNAVKNLPILLGYLQLSLTFASQTYKSID